MSNLDLLKSVFGASNRINYVPHNINDTLVFLGAPFVRIRGLSDVTAYHKNAQTKYIASLTGAGVFVHNKNRSGIIELSILNASASGAAIAALTLTGIPFPISVIDKKTNGLGSVFSPACQQVLTPQWSRSKNLGIKTYTFECKNLMILNGMKKLV